MPPRQLVSRLLLGCLGVGGGAAPDARACATCETGDPTLTVAGAELPLAGRLRSALELRRRTDSIGRPGLDEMQISELRAELSTVWSPVESVALMAAVPMLYRDVTDASLARSQAWGLGDLELRARWLCLRDRDFAPRWLFAWTLGAKLPLAPWHENARGERLPLEAQPGTGSLDLLLGPSLTWLHGTFSAYLSAHWSEPLATRDPLEPGRSLRGSLALQYQLVTWAAVRSAADGRWGQPSREDGVRDPDSGGYLLLGGVDALFRPWEDASVLLGFRLPVYQGLTGAHEEGPTVSLALLYDW
jgi:hypothetical protein